MVTSKGMRRRGGVWDGEKNNAQAYEVLVKTSKKKEII
jgi:hypothetical protein